MSTPGVDPYKYLTEVSRKIDTLTQRDQIETALDEVEYLFEHCPNIDMIVRGEGEEIIKQIVSGVPYEDILGLSYRENERIVHNEIHPLPDIACIPFPDRSLRQPCSHAVSGTDRETVYV